MMEDVVDMVEELLEGGLAVEVATDKVGADATVEKAYAASRRGEVGREGEELWEAMKVRAMVEMVLATEEAVERQNNERARQLLGKRNPGSQCRDPQPPQCMLEMHTHHNCHPRQTPHRQGKCKCHPTLLHPQHLRIQR
jgi:hypothetical protein